MSQDDQQLRQKIPPELRAYEASIDAGTAAWRDYHQAGVWWSELAESAWWLRMEGWWRAAELFGTYAQVRFNGALRRAPIDPVARAAIQTDIAMLGARLGRFNDAHEPLQAITALEDAIRTLESTLAKATGDRLRAAVIHQLAITYGFLSRMHWGDALGFRNDAEEVLAIQASAKALHYFDREAIKTPDGERAYRSHLLMQALAQSRQGNAYARRQLALLAIRSAQKHGDRKHAYRGCTIYLMGAVGEKMLRRLRDNNAVYAAT